MNRETTKKPKMEMKVVQIIQRVRAGEDAEEVVRGLRDGKDEKDGSEGLKEDIGRFLKKARVRGNSTKEASCNN